MRRVCREVVVRSQASPVTGPRYCLSLVWTRRSRPARALPPRTHAVTGLFLSTLESTPQTGHAVSLADARVLRASCV